MRKIEQPNFVLGIRIKKPKDLAKDPTPEVEYMGGKIEAEDGNDPLQTAYKDLLCGKYVILLVIRILENIGRM